MHDDNLSPEELARRLDAALGDTGGGRAGSRRAPSWDEHPMVQAARWLSEAPPPALSADAANRIRGRVLAAARETAAPHRPLVIRILTVVASRAAAALLILVIAGLVALPAAANSLPGEPLYSVKQGIESIELLLASDASAQASVTLTHAGRRLDEAERMLSQGRLDAELLSTALETLARAGEIATEAALDPAEIQAMQNRAREIENGVIAVATLAASTDNIAQATIDQITMGLQNIRETPNPLLPPPVSMLSTTATPTLTPTLTPSAAATATEAPTTTNTPSVTPSDTASPTAPKTPSPTPTDTDALLQAVVPTGDNTDNLTEPFEIVFLDEEQNGVLSAGQQINVRTGPGTSYDILTAVDPGTAVTALGTNEAGDWFYLRLNDGHTGWVAEFLVTLTGSGSPVGRPTQSSSADEPGSDDQCDLPGSACDAPGQKDNPPPGQGGSPPGQGDDPPPGHGGDPPGQGGGRP